MGDELSGLLGGLSLGRGERRSHPHQARRQLHNQPLAIGDRQFESIDEAWAHINRVKQRLLALGRPVGPSDPDFGFLRGLLARHPKGPAKVEHPPVESFMARPNVSGRGTELHFIDSWGQEHDFSAKKCME